MRGTYWPSNVRYPSAVQCAVTINRIAPNRGRIAIRPYNRVWSIHGHAGDPLYGVATYPRIPAGLSGRIASSPMFAPVLPDARVAGIVRWLPARHIPGGM